MQSIYLQWSLMSKSWSTSPKIINMVTRSTYKVFWRMFKHRIYRLQADILIAKYLEQTKWFFKLLSYSKYFKMKQSMTSSVHVILNLPFISSHISLWRSVDKLSRKPKILFPLLSLKPFRCNSALLLLHGNKLQMLSNQFLICYAT